MTDSTTVSCGSGEDRSRENEAPAKQPAAVWRDLFDPGWREREAERVQKFLDKIPLRERGPL